VYDFPNKLSLKTEDHTQPFTAVPSIDDLVDKMEKIVPGCSTYVDTDLIGTIMDLDTILNKNKSSSSSNANSPAGKSNSPIHSSSVNDFSQRILNKVTKEKPKSVKEILSSNSQSLLKNSKLFP
jgi:hypothetical protein